MTTLRGLDDYPRPGLAVDLAILTVTRPSADPVLRLLVQDRDVFQAPGDSPENWTLAAGPAADAQALAREVPKGLEPQVYMMSLMAIDFDNRTEAEYLNSLAQAMGIDRQVINQIHQHVGVQNLYA